MHWLTVEVFDAELPASAWERAWHDALVEAAITTGALFWDVHHHQWGTVLEFCFGDEQARDRLRSSPVLNAALDAAPDPVNGVLVYPHRGGGTGSRVPRRPRPSYDAGAASLPVPEELVELSGIGDYIPPRDPLVAA
jgi:hypothetical protein